MKMTMKEWRMYTRRQAKALWSHVTAALSFGSRRPIPFMSRSQWTMYSRIGTSGYFTLEAHLARLKERQTFAAITSVENAPRFTQAAVIEAWKDFDVAHSDITEKSDG